MKIKVNRSLNQGKYRVNFEVSDFTPEELSKMSSFGVPAIDMVLSTTSGTMSTKIPLNQIGKNYEAVYPNREAAIKYEEQVLTQIKVAMEYLRQSKDDFSSSEEVVL